MFGLGATEIVIIVIVFAIIFFGGKKLGDLAKSAGRFTGEFRKGKFEVEQEIRDMQDRG